MAGLTALGIPSVSHAVPYASQISESGGIVTFRLNEAADNVKVVFTGPNSTLDMGAVPRGVTNFNRGGAASYEIQVTKSAPPAWSLISSDSDPLNQFFAPLSVAVNRNPGSTNFGRIYILEDGGIVTGGRTTTEGVFVNNPDVTDAFAQGNTGLQAGLGALTIFAATGGSDRYDPFAIEVGDDDYLYITDANNPRGALLRTTPDVTTGEEVLFGVGNTVAPSVHTVTYGIAVKGSLAANNLKIWATDGQWSSSTLCNSILRYDINGGPLPYNTAPTLIASPGPNTSERDSDLDVAPDGNIFFTVVFDGGTGATGVPALSVYSPAGALLWNSTNNLASEIFTNVYQLKVSPDNTKLAMIRRDRQTWIVGLTNGPNGRIPDISQTNVVATFASVGVGNGRCVTWDLAGNLYVANRSSERLRVWSPGGTTTATTTSGGAFGITVPANTVTITNVVSSQSESNGTAITFTVSRTGNTASPLFTTFLFTGTASNGVDHTAFPTAITFPAGVTTTNISVTLTDDAISETSETLTVAINGGTNYGAGTPASRTVTILDDDTPEVSVALAQSETRLLEGYSHSTLGFQFSRKGYLPTSVTVNIGYSGSATAGADYSGPATVTFAANAVTTNVSLASIDDQSYEGNETAIVGVATGAGYNVGSPTNATGTVIEDDPTTGTVLFADDFEVDSSGNWVTNADNPLDAGADFAFDYSTLFVPPVPGGTSTKGLRFRLNETGGASAPRNGVSASPATINLPDEYRLRFKAWINYHGSPMFNGGAGSTMHLTAGVGTTPDHANLATSAFSDGIWFAASGDGGSTPAAGDVNAYGPALFNDDSGYYAAGTGPVNSGIRTTPHPFYAIWGAITAPAAQVANFPLQAGLSGPGNLGVSWHTFVITKTTNTVEWAVDGIVIATVPANVTPLSTNVFVGFQDIFVGASGTPAMTFVLVENLRVESLTAPAIITITSVTIVGGNVEVTFSGADVAAGSFKLQSSTTVNGTYLDDNTASIISTGTGTFKATTAYTGGVLFFKIKL